MAKDSDTRETLLRQVANLPGYELRDGSLYYQGGECRMDEDALRQILDANDRPYDAMG